MNRIAGLAILVLGIILIAWGVHASDSLASSFSKLFTGSPTDKAVTLVIGGVLLSAMGASLVLRPPSPRA